MEAAESKTQGAPLNDTGAVCHEIIQKTTPEACMEAVELKIQGAPSNDTGAVLKTAPEIDIKHISIQVRPNLSAR